MGVKTCELKGITMQIIEDYDPVIFNKSLGKLTAYETGSTRK